MEVCQYSKDELVGKPHNIVRHPDMPKVVFKMMWDRINKGENIKAVVKNLAKDGRYYWVMTDFEPTYNSFNNTIRTHTAYRKAAPKKAVDAIIPIYKKLLEIEKIEGMDASEKFLNEYLSSNGKTYDEFIDEITDYKGLTRQFFEMMKKIFR